MITGNPLRVLLVDANMKRRDLTVRELVRDGCDVEPSTPGLSIIRQALAYWPDVVVVRRRWRRTERRLRANPYLRHMKVICCHA